MAIKPSHIWSRISVIQQTEIYREKPAHHLVSSKEKMEPLIELLQAINNGLLTLKPLGNSEKEMNDFQSVVKLLKYAEGKGLITKIKIHTESRTSHGWHDLALVQGGLTIEGMEYLNNFSVEDEPKANINEDIIELKPNFMGIGININALIRWFKK